MQLTETIRLRLTKTQTEQIEHAQAEYRKAVNGLVSLAMSGVNIARYSSKDVAADLPGAVRGQVAQDARSIVRKHERACKDILRRNEWLAARGKPSCPLPQVPVLKRPSCYWNNQNFRILSDGSLSFPVMEAGRSVRITVSTYMTPRQQALLSGRHLGTLRIVRKGDKLVAQVSYEALEPGLRPLGKTMGIDLGLKCPAVSYTEDGTVRFFGNGRKNKYLRRHYRYVRKKLQTKKKLSAVKRLRDKEQRIMRDIDHKLSAAIIKEAVRQGVRVIKLERLENIRKATRTSRKNNHSLHTWSFYRLARYLTYKARQKGIEVVTVNPAYTSKRCPVCGEYNTAADRHYRCSCGFHSHRDIVGARNICASEPVGHRPAA